MMSQRCPIRSLSNYPCAWSERSRTSPRTPMRVNGFSIPLRGPSLPTARVQTWRAQAVRSSVRVPMNRRGRVPVDRMGGRRIAHLPAVGGPDAACMGRRLHPEVRDRSRTPRLARSPRSDLSNPTALGAETPARRTTGPRKLRPTAREAPGDDLRSGSGRKSCRSRARARPPDQAVAPESPRPPDRRRRRRRRRVFRRVSTSSSATSSASR